MELIMITTLDCIPCLLRQTLEAARFCTSSNELQADILKKILHVIAEADIAQSPPQVARELHRQLKSLTGIDDPYRNIKDQFNSLAISMLETLTEEINRAPEPLIATIKLSIAGNVIDCGATTGISETEVHTAISRSCSAPLAGDVEEFLQAVEGAEKILYIADNAGEIVFDRLLIEKLGADRITLAVRGFPVINDATIIDARAAGLDKIVPVVENGTDVPGTIIEECSDEFRKCFQEADLIIAKGQGNYETLCDEKRKNIFFLLKIKCPLIADHTGYPTGTHTILKSRPKIPSAINVIKKEPDTTVAFFQCKSIGIVHSEHVNPSETPVQSIYAKGCSGYIKIFPEYADGLKDIEGFSHIYVLFHLHRSGKAGLLVKPFLDDEKRGVFATRAPARPNPIGMSIVELIKREGTSLYVDGLDILDGTPVIDIKPYTARFDRIETTSNGWQDSVDDITAGKRGLCDYKKEDNTL